MSTPATYFGKVPFHGDFIGLARPQPVVRMLDEWIQGGLLRIRERRRDWQAEFDAVASMRFVAYGAGAQSPFAGVMWPSHDRTDRRYPFVVGVQVPECPERSCWSAVPLALDDYLSAVELTPFDDWQDADIDLLRERIAGLVWRGSSTDPAHELQEGLGRVTADAMWRELPGFESSERRCLLMQDLLELMTASTTPRFVFRIPCSGDSVTVGFWLGLLRAWSRPDRTVRMIAWQPPTGTGQPVLRVLFDDLSPRYFEPVFWPEREHDQGFDVAYATDLQAARIAGAQERFAASIDSGTTLASLLQNVTQAGRPASGTRDPS